MAAKKMKCTCWLGKSNATSGDSRARELCAVHGYRNGLLASNTLASTAMAQFGAAAWNAAIDAAVEVVSFQSTRYPSWDSLQKKMIALKELKGDL